MDLRYTECCQEDNDFILQMIRIILTSRPLGKEDSRGNFMLANDVDHLDQPVPCKEIDSIQQYSLVCVRHEIVVQGVASCKSCCSDHPLSGSLLVEQTSCTEGSPEQTISACCTNLLQKYLMQQ